MEKEQDLHQQEAPNSMNDHAEPMETAPTPKMNASPDGEEPKPRNGNAASTTEPQTSLTELQERFLRLAADFANYKRRAETERAEIADWARRDFALALLPILDDFGLMMEYEAQHPERLAEGARLIRQKTMDLLTRHGLEKIEAVNQPYDYESHEAVLSQPVKDQAFDHQVLAVMQDGYRFKGKVLRPSKVIVGQYVEPESAAVASEKAADKKTEPN